MIIWEELMEDLYNYMKWGDYNKVIANLASMALPENWSFPNQDSNGILKNYLSHTFDKLVEEGKLIETDSYCAFNTGLFTKYFEEIFVYGDLVDPCGIDKFYFNCFCTQYELGKFRVNQVPQRADYFRHPELLIFDWHYPIRVQYSHILDDERNAKRLPKIIVDSKLPLQTLTGVIDNSIKRVIANYKLAVPQYFNGRIQLLIPLYFEDDTRPDLALVLTKSDDGYYLGHTCLTLDMAYNNARLIAKPESNWLVP